MSWECPVCFEQLGQKAGLVPMTSTACRPVAHLICMACVERLDDETKCPLCNTETEFVPLSVLVSEDDKEAAGALAAFHTKRHAEVPRNKSSAAPPARADREQPAPLPMAPSRAAPPSRADREQPAPLPMAPSHVAPSNSFLHQDRVFGYDRQLHGEFNENTCVPIMGELCAQAMRTDEGAFARITVPNLSSQVKDLMLRVIHHSPGLCLVDSHHMQLGAHAHSNFYVRRVGQVRF